MKHTASPWTIHATDWKDDDGNTVAPIISDAPEMAGQRLICLVRERSDNRLANARLIAAAPEMLEALKAAYVWSQSTGDERTMTTFAFRVLPKIEAIIAKVEGKEE